MSDPNNRAEAFSAIEEEFFRAGDEISAAAGEPSSDRDAEPARPGVWSRLFKRKARPATERPYLGSPRPSTGV